MASAKPKPAAGPLTRALTAAAKEEAVQAAHPDTTTSTTADPTGPRPGDPARGVFDTGGTTSVDGSTAADAAHPSYADHEVRALQGEHVPTLRQELAKPEGFVSSTLDLTSAGGQQVIGNASAIAARRTTPPATSFADPPAAIKKSLDAAVTRRDRAEEKARKEAAKAVATA